VPEVRLVGPNGEQVGVVRIEDAIRLAQEADLDLVEVAPNSKPPVAKIMDFGKFKYETAQKAKEAKRNQSNTILKEVRFRLKIDVHDYETKRKRAEGFLQGGDKVKAMILFRGREQSRPEQGVRLLQRFAEDVSEFGTVESTPMIDGRNMVMVIGPLKTKAEVKAEHDAKKPATRERTERPVHAPVQSAPVSKAPTVASSETVSAPAVESIVEAAAAAPPAKDPVAKDPIAKDPAAKAPVAKGPVALAPVAKAPVAKDPVASAPVASVPVPAPTAVATPMAATKARTAKPATETPAVTTPAVTTPAPAGPAAATAAAVTKPAAAAKPTAAPRPSAVPKPSAATSTPKPSAAPKPRATTKTAPADVTSD
jgi:translation initiation factor IF-3